MLLAMLLNPEAEFFKDKMAQPGSYVRRIKHANPAEIEAKAIEFFAVETEYFLGIKDRDIFESQRPDLASIYVIKGIKK